MNRSFIKKIGAIALAMVFFLFLAPFSAGALTPVEVAKLVASDGAVGDYFGYSVAVDGDTAVIGAYGDGNYGTNSGSAYVFSRSGSTWVQQAKLTAPDGASGDFFGVSVAVDGDTAVIGAHYDEDNGPGSGSAYVFSRISGTWAQQAKLKAPNWAAGSLFGYSVAVDGDTAVIGAYGDYYYGTNSGAAYVFSRSGSTWEQQAKITAPGGAANQYFGLSVAVDGDTAVIGAFGDGNYFNSGAAYVFSRSGGIWLQQAKLTASDEAAGDYFGWSVAVDGNTAAVIGVRYDDDKGTSSGSAYVFSLAPPDNDQDGVPDDQDNCPDTPNPDQADTDYDTLGDACDVTFNAEAVIDVLEFECSSSIELLTAADPPGVKGMISKLTGNATILILIDLMQH